MTRTRPQQSRNAAGGPPCHDRASNQPRERVSPTTPGRGDQGPSGGPDAEPRILASFLRDVDGDQGAMRVVLGEFQGRPLLHLRIYVRTRDGRWLPTKAGVTVRAAELDATIEALTKARDEIRSGGRLTYQPRPSRPPSGGSGDSGPSRRLAHEGHGSGRNLPTRVPEGWPVDPATGLPEPPW